MQDKRGFASTTEEGKKDNHQPPTRVYGIGGKYATALWRAASKSGDLEKVAEELNKVNTLAETNERFSQFLRNPITRRSQKTRTMKGIIDDIASSQTTKQFFGMPLPHSPALPFSFSKSEWRMRLAAVLAENGRLDKLGDIVRKFEEMRAAQRGEVKAVVTTAEPLDQEDMDMLKNALKSWVSPDQHLQIETKVDSSLVGGFVVNIGDRQVDLSLDSRIKRAESILRQSL